MYMPGLRADVVDIVQRPNMRFTISGGVGRFTRNRFVCVISHFLLPAAGRYRSRKPCARRSISPPCKAPIHAQNLPESTLEICDVDWNKDYRELPDESYRGGEKNWHLSCSQNGKLPPRKLSISTCYFQPAMQNAKTRTHEDPKKKNKQTRAGMPCILGVFFFFASSCLRVLALIRAGVSSDSRVSICPRRLATVLLPHAAV